MIAEALKYLASLATEAAAPKKLDEDARQVRYAIGGKVVDLAKPAPARDHAPKSLDDVIELANRFAKDGGPKPVVWYDESEVVVVVDDDHYRAETASLTLEVSDVFARLKDLREHPQWLEPKPFVRLLRVELARTLEPRVLLEQVKVFKFENGVTTSGVISRERESLGREITSRVERGAEIPEEVTLLAPVYKTLGRTAPLGVRCAVEVDPARGAFQLLPLPDEIERVQHLAVEAIGEELRGKLDAEVPCYYGKA